jgi:alkaline phosphatase D
LTTRRDLLWATAGLPLLGSSGLAVAEGGSTVGGLAAAATIPVVAGVRRPDTARLPQRIAFGSCAEGAVPQPIWEAVLAADPDLFIFLGDNIYGDTRDPAVLSAKYAQFAAGVTQSADDAVGLRLPSVRDQSEAHRVRVAERHHSGVNI